jgi:MoxR-like ATPase
LPEAQLDRFMFNILLDYPSFDEEMEIVKSTITRNLPEPNAVMNGDEIIYFQKLMQRIPIVDNVYRYAVNLSVITRPETQMAHAYANKYLSWGAGPRASQNLIMAARCHALILGKHAPDIEDVKAVAPSILRHRLVKNYKAEAEGISIDNIIQTFLNSKH